MAEGKVLKTIIDIGGNINPSLSKSIKSVINLLGGMNSEVLGSAAQLGAVGLAVGGAVSAVKAVAKEIGRDIEAAASWEQAMTGVVKVTDGLRDSSGKYTAQYYEVEKSLRSLALDYPVEMETIADAAAAALQDGTINIKDVVKATRDAIKVSQALDVSMEEAGQALSYYRLNFGYTEDQAYDLADAINYLGQNSGRLPSEINSIVSELSGLGGIANIDAKSLAALGATIAGIEDSSASTAIKNLVLALQSGSSATKAQKSVFAQLGLDAKEFSRYMYTDTLGAMNTFFDALDENVAKEDRLQTIKKLFGKTSTEGLAILFNQHGWDNLHKNLQILQSGEYKGSINIESANLSETYLGQKQLLDNAIQNLRITAGESLLPNVTPMIEDLSDFLVDHGDELGEMLSQLGGTVINPQSVETVKSVLSLAETALPVINTQVQITSTTLTGITSIISKGAQYLSELPSKVKEVATSIAGDIKDAAEWLGFGNKKGEAGGWGDSGLETMLKGIAAKAVSAKNKIFDLSEVDIGNSVLFGGLTSITAKLGNIIGNAVTSKTKMLNLSAVDIYGGALFGGLSLLATKLSSIVTNANSARNSISLLSSAVIGGGISGIGSKIANSIKGSSKLKGHAAGGFSSVPAIFGEAGPEVAISFDPKYRSQNVGYWQRAGQLLGMLDEKGALLSGSGSGSGSGSESGGITVVVENKQTITVSNGTVENVRRAISASDPDFIDKVAAAIRQAQEGRYSPNGNCFVY